MADVESLELQIVGDARSAEQSINSLINTLERLNKATSGGCGLNAVANGMNKVSSASSSTASSNAKSAASFTNLAAKVGVAYQAIRKVNKTIASWVGESNEYIENANLFSVAMGKYAESAMEYANKVSDVMGIDPSDWIRNQGLFMTLGTGFGIAGDRAATMSQQLTQLGYDLSSFYNISVEEAMAKLKSGFSGELEPLRNLGYDLSQAKLEAIALSLGIDKSVSSMTQAEKAQLRYYAIMTQVTSAQGDMARTLTAPANQLRVLQAQVTQAARALGNIFIPALNAVLPYVIAVVKVITMLAQSLASLFGITLEVDFSGASTSLGDVGGAAQDTSKGLGKAANNAKKLNKILLGIDELNVLPDSSASSGGGGSGGAAGGAGGFDFALPTYDFLGDAVNQKVDEIVKKIMGIVEKVKEWLGLNEDINSWADFLQTRLGRILSLIGLIAAGIALWKVSNAFLSALDAIKNLKPGQPLVIGATLAITGFTLAFTGMKSAIENGLDGLNFAEIIGGGLMSAGGAAILGSKLATWIGTAFSGSAIDLAITQAGINLGVGTVGAAGAAIAGAFTAVIVGIPAYFVGIYDAIKNGIDWLSGLLIGAGATAAGAGIGAIIGMIGGPIGAGVGAIIGLAVGLITDGIILLVQNWEAVSAWFSEVFASIGSFFSDLWVSIQSIWNSVASWFDSNVIQPVVGFFSNLWTSVSGFFVSLWADIVAIAAPIPEWFNSNVVQPVVEFFSGLWSGIVSVFTACWQGIVDAFTPAIEWFSALFGSVFQTVSDIFYNIGVIAKGCWEIIKAVWKVVSDWFDSTVIQPVCDFFEDLWDAVTQLASDAWDGIKKVYSIVVTWFDSTIIQPLRNFFTAMWNTIKTIASATWTGIQSVAISAWNGIKAVYNTVATWFNTTIVQPVTTFFSNLWDGFLTGAKNAWAGVKSVFSTVASFFSDTFKKAWAGIVKVFSVAGDIFVDIKNGIVSAFKTVVNGLIRGINKVVSVPFNAINTALGKLRDISIMGLSPFTGLKNISVPSIPLLAGGGIVSSGQVFVANEAGPELVANVGRKTAVMNNDQIVESVSRGVYQAVARAMVESGNGQVVEAKVNDKVLFEVVVNRNRQETMRTGYSPLLGGV